MMQIRLACQPLTWGGSRAQFEQAVRDIAGIGFDGVEPSVSLYLDDIQALRALLDELGLGCASTYTGGAFEDAEQRVQLTAGVVRTASLLPQLGCDRIVLSAGPRAGYLKPDGVPLEVLERFADGVTECARQCYEQYGVKSVFHNHAWTLIESPREVDLLLELTDPLFVLAGFDTAQLAYGGYDPAEAFTKWRERIGYVHIKDNNPALPTAMPVAEKNALRSQGHVFWPLGQGALGDAGLDAVLQVLREIDYQGWITSELDTSDLPPRDANAANYDWLIHHVRSEERVSQ